MCWQYNWKDLKMIQFWELHYVSLDAVGHVLHIDL